MPHLRLYALGELGGLEPRLEEILRFLVEEFCGLESVKSSSVKGYVLRDNGYVPGEGAPTGHLHCEISVLEGRSDELLCRIADTLDACLRYECTGTPVGVTVEVREMKSLTYRK